MKDLEGFRPYQAVTTDERPLKPGSGRPGRKLRLAYFVTHPIQYQAPLLRRIAQEADIDLKVYFFSDISVPFPARGGRDGFS